jgi:hypothetical protein
MMNNMYRPHIVGYVLEKEEVAFNRLIFLCVHSNEDDVF